MTGSRLNVRLFRDSFKTPWGFRLQGGKDLSQPLTVQRVFSNSPAERELQRGDVILAIGGEDTTKLTHKQAQDAIKHGGGQIHLIINRPPLGAAIVSPLSPPIITQRPKAPTLQELSSPKSPYRPIHITTYNRDPYQNHTMPMQNNYHKPPQHTGNTYYYQQPPSPQFQPPRRQRDTYSQPPFQSPTTPTTPPPPWATRQAAPKRVTKLSQLGGGGFTFGTSYNTLPRRGTRQSWAYYGELRPAPDRKTPEREENDGEPERLATGPPPKVCNLSNLGGGGYLFGSGFGSSATLPRRNPGRRLSQPPSMPSGGNYGFSPTKVTMNKFGGGPSPFGTDFSYGRPTTTPAQRYEPQSDKGVMLNKVQSSLDNITLSPRTPEPYQGSPFSPQYPSQPPPQQVYTPTGLLLEQQRLEEERRRQQQLQQQQQQHQYEPQYEPRHYQPEPQQYQPQPQQYQPSPYQDELEEGEVIVPVWERRKQFQQGAPEQASVRTPRNKPPPKVLKPKPGSGSFNDFGTSYNKPAQKQSIAVWQPSPQPTQVQTPVAPYSPAPVHVIPVNVETPVKSTPPSWQRPQNDDDDETDAIPAWRNTLRSTGVKPWDTDVNYSPSQQARSVPYNPTPYQNIQQYSPSKGPVTPVGDDKTDGPKVVHLQYNSPMGLYSNDNVAETLRGQTSCLSGQSKNPQTNLPGERDWSQSAVLRFIEQEGSRKPKGRAPPATAPKPTVHHQPPPPQQQQPYYADVGVSDF